MKRFIRNFLTVVFAVTFVALMASTQHAEAAKKKYSVASTAAPTNIYYDLYSKKLGKRVDAYRYCATEYGCKWFHKNSSGAWERFPMYRSDVTRFYNESGKRATKKQIAEFSKTIEGKKASSMVDYHFSGKTPSTASVPMRDQMVLDTKDNTFKKIAMPNMSPSEINTLNEMRNTLRSGKEDPIYNPTGKKFDFSKKDDVTEGAKIAARAMVDKEAQNGSYVNLNPEDITKREDALAATIARNNLVGSSVIPISGKVTDQYGNTVEGDGENSAAEKAALADVDAKLDSKKSIEQLKDGGELKNVPLSETSCKSLKDGIKAMRKYMNKSGFNTTAGNQDTGRLAARALANRPDLRAIFNHRSVGTPLSQIANPKGGITTKRQSGIFVPTSCLLSGGANCLMRCGEKQEEVACLDISKEFQSARKNIEQEKGHMTKKRVEDYAKQLAAKENDGAYSWGNLPHRDKEYIAQARKKLQDERQTLMAERVIEPQAKRQAFDSVYRYNLDLREDVSDLLNKQKKEWDDLSPTDKMIWINSAIGNASSSRKERFEKALEKQIGYHERILRDKLASGSSELLKNLDTDLKKKYEDEIGTFAAEGVDDEKAYSGKHKKTLACVNGDMKSTPGIMLSKDEFNILAGSSIRGEIEKTADDTPARAVASGSSQ